MSLLYDVNTQTITEEPVSYVVTMREVAIRFVADYSGLSGCSLLYPNKKDPKDLYNLSGLKQSKF